MRSNYADCYSIAAAIDSKNPCCCIAVEAFVDLYEVGFYRQVGGVYSLRCSLKTSVYSIEIMNSGETIERPWRVCTIFEVFLKI